MKPRPEQHRSTTRSASVRRAAWVLSAFVAAAAALANEISVYSWTDEDGIVHYSDVPIDPRARATGLQSERTDPSRIREQQLRQWEQARRDAQENERRQVEEREEAERRIDESSTAEERCAIARDRATRYTDAHSLYVAEPDGGRRYLSEEELSATREAAWAEVDKWCN